MRTVMLSTRAADGGDQRAIAVWLLVCCAMIFIMVVLGGVTRLTHSGLSMVEWRPLTGWLPPRGQAEWQTTFDKYQQFPEFQKLHGDMTLEGFKSIFWFEFIHRLWGRFIGLVFFIPFLYFLLRGQIRGKLMRNAIGLFLIGALQGILGWYLVKSGLIDRPDVSQYRLTAHLGLAFLIYGYIFWVVLGLLFPNSESRKPGNARRLRRTGLLLLALVSITILSGGLVAGLDAGLAYNTFPLMGGRLIPEHVFAVEPGVMNFFENIAAVQFSHRCLAILTCIGVTVLWLMSRPYSLGRRCRSLIYWLLGAAVLQLALGISTLLLKVPVALAAAHQATALVFFTLTLWVVRELSG